MHNDIDTLRDPRVPRLYGCAPETVEHWIGRAHKLGAGKRVITVEHWSWWSLNQPEKYAEACREAGIQPVFLYAQSVISDSSGQFQPGDWVRTSPLQQLHDQVLFETRNSMYVLVGPGDRRQVDTRLILQLIP